MGEKIKRAAEEAFGKVRKTTGEATGSENLEAQGQAEQAQTDVKPTGDTAKGRLP